MKYLPESISYPDNEKPKLALLESLFRDWHQHFANNSAALVKHKPEEMVFDGFYPHYFQQKKKVLFIGWESVDISGCNYIDVLSYAYRVKQFIGPRTLNRDKVHSRILRIAHGILNGMPEWQEIPSASEIGGSVGAETGTSFAMMNISKLSNDSGGSKADWPVINVAHTLSTQGRNFTQEEIAILQPDIVITMNLEEKLDSLGQLTKIHFYNEAESYWLDCCGRRCLLVNTWHFAARNKTAADYYEPICDALRRSESVEKPHSTC